MRSRLVACSVAGALGLGACSAGPTRATGATTTGAPAHSAPSTTTLPTSSEAPTTTTVTGTSNVAVTDQIRAQLVAAGAALNSLTPSDYTGLVPGKTYYAYDATTQTYWAGAGLLPGPASTRAQVASQDDGAFLLFERQAGRAWKAYAVGLAGTRIGGACPIAVPPAVLTLWGWPANSCRPATI